MSLSPVTPRRNWSLMFWIGLALTIGYAILVHPTGFPRGYLEDFCTDVNRMVMADSLKSLGRPGFFSERFFAPTGISVAFFSWALERDWLGAIFFNWNPDFPYLWSYVFCSLVITFVSLGWLLRKMDFTPRVAWSLATFFVIFHIPRHFKFWHHYEYLALHWIYWSFFLDAWIWRRFTRDRVWSWDLEIWRGFLLVGAMSAPGYFWGATQLEWLVIHLFVGIFWYRWRKQGQPVRIEFTLKKAALPLALTAVYLTLEAFWFPPLFAEARKVGPVPQGLAYFANILQWVRPLWFDWAFAPILSVLGLRWNIIPMTNPETVVTIGWVYWLPVLIGLRLLRKRGGGPGWIHVAPFVTLFGIIFIYGALPDLYFVYSTLKRIVPPLQFFRVASRWGLFLPPLAGAILVLVWPELSAWARGLWGRRKRWILLFALSSAIEALWLFYPVNEPPTLHASTEKLLADLSQAPGTTVLDLPFCVAGGNGVCTDAQCPQYPRSTVGQCFSGRHGKKVFGLYQSRMTFEQCEIYNKLPYTQWFQAWGQQRCFKPEEWNQFCGFLKEHTELSAVLVYPDIWTPLANDPACVAEFERHLGPTVAEGRFVTDQQRGAKGGHYMRIWRFEPRCR